MSELPLRFFAATDVGRVRDHNEDNFLVDKKLGLFMVADGMGGHAAGEVASAICVRTVHEELKKERDLIADYLSGATGAKKVTPKDIVALFEHAVQSACLKIHEEAQGDQNKRGMGTTLSAILVLGHQGFIAHVGDSRIYMMRGGRIQQVTEDHTVFNELIKRGKLTKEQIEKVGPKANAITRAVGVYERVDVDTLVIEVLPGDAFVLASDGLTGYLDSPEELREPLAMEGDQVVKKLIDLANERGGKDNITTVVVRIGTEGVQDEARAQRLALKREVLTRLGVGEHFGEMSLIRSVPRSATVTADGKSELIAIRRTEFFEILRKEHEIAVKMLWQFLGVLADRLDQTSADLRHAKQELAAEDITEDLYPETEVTSPFGRNPLG